LAYCYAQMGQLPKAMKTADSAMTTGPYTSAPILPAVLLELVPAIQGRGDDVELAQLLERAIRKHQATVVDPTWESGKAFLKAKPFHIHNAWVKVIELYSNGGRPDLAERARQRALASLSRSVS